MRLTQKASRSNALFLKTAALKKKNRNTGALSRPSAALPQIHPSWKASAWEPPSIWEQSSAGDSTRDSAGGRGRPPRTIRETTNFRAQERPQLARKRGGGRHAQLQTQETYGLAAIGKEAPLPRERRKRRSRHEGEPGAREGSPALAPAPAPRPASPPSLPLVRCPGQSGRLP